MAETNQTQKYTDEQKIALEKQLIKEGKILPRTRYAPKGYVGRILAVLLAFLFGIFVTIGGILGAGFYAGTRPLKDVFGMFNFDYSQWLTDTAADMSVLQLTQQLTGGGIDSLGALSAYTPYVDTLLGQIGTQLQELGVTLDNEELKATSFSEIGKYLSDTIQSVELGKVLKVTAQSDPLMLALCYGTEGTNEEGGDYTVNDADEIVMNEGKEPTRITSLVDDAGGIIGKVTIEAALSVNADSNATVRYLAYGVEGEDYRIVEEDGSRVIEMLTDPITGEKHRKKLLNELTGSTDIVGNATISDLVTIDENSSSLLQTIRDWTVSDLSNSARIDRVRISQLLEVNESSSAILQVMADWRISDLKDQKKIDSLLLGDIVTIKSDSPSIMKSLANTRLDQLAQATDELRLTDILGEQAAQMLERVCINELLGGTNVYYSGVTGGIPATSRGGVNAPLTLSLQRRVVRGLKRQLAQPITRVVTASPAFNTSPVAPAYVAVCHTDIESDIRNMPGFVPVEKYASYKPLEGEIGSVEGVRYLATTLLDPWLSAGAAPQAGTPVESSDGSCADVYPILFFGKDAFGVTPFAGKHTIQPMVLNPNTPRGGDPLGQRGSISWKAYRTAVILYDFWMARVEVAAGKP